METLTSGVMADIIEGGHPEDPVVQILSMKRIPSDSQEHWRLLLSDGKWSSNFVVLAIHLSSKVDTGEIKNNCIISIDRYVCNTVQENKKVLIILDLSVVKTGEEVGQKLGSPATYDPNKNASQQQHVPAQKQLNKPPVSKVTPSAGSTGGIVLQNCLGQNSVSTQEPVIMKTPSGGSVQPVAALSSKSNRWTICARVTNKSAIRTWSNSKGEGKFFSMDLLDESGEIRATAFNEQCDKFYDMIEIDKVYFISTATLKTANKQYSNLNNEYEMIFKRGTEVTPCHEATAIPTMQFNFVSFDQLEGLSKDSIVDVIGVCKETFDISFVTTRFGEEITKRDLQLIDTMGREVRLTLWRTQAETFDGSQQPVIAVKGVKVSYFNGVSLSSLSSSHLLINPDIREAHTLKAWFGNGGNVAQTVNLSGKTPVGVTGDFKLFAEAQQSTGLDNPEHCSLKGVIVRVQKENSTYSACPKVGCSKKVVDQGNSQYRCEKCDQSYDSFKWCIILKVCVADISDSHWVTIFQDEAQRLLNTTSDELGLLRETNNGEFEKIMDSILFKNYNFRLRCKIETYNGESRWKPTVMSFAPVNPMEHGRRLLTEMKQMSGE